MSEIEIFIELKVASALRLMDKLIGSVKCNHGTFYRNSCISKFLKMNFLKKWRKKWRKKILPQYVTQ